MTPEKIKTILDTIRSLKEKEGLRIYDTHVHPYDVMGVLHYKKYHSADSGRSIDISDKFGILEFFKFGKIVNIVSPFYYKFFGSSVHSIIRKMFGGRNTQSILDEMEHSFVDYCTLLPIEPWLTTDFIYNNFQNEKFLLVGSFDIVNDTLDEIKRKLEVYIHHHKIVGIKLHPNLQGFLPQPSANPPAIKEKLEYIYSQAAENKKYLLFHAGISFFTDKVSEDYMHLERRRDNALLRHFIDEDGNSEILGKYNVPIIFAHLGHFGLSKINYQVLKLIIQRYKDIYFDTSGVSPKMLTDMGNIVTSQRIVFGSDALYNSMRHSVLFTYEGAAKMQNGEKLNDIFFNIFGLNYSAKILKNNNFS